MFIALDIYPNRLKMKDSASRKRVSTKTLIERNGCSIVKINNAGDDPLSPCPAGAKLETAFSSGLGIYSTQILIEKEIRNG